jgi:tetratricopeptide (TPR) repeat protein
VVHTQKRYEEALEHYDHVVRLRPDYLEGRLNRGNTLLERERFDKALAHFQRAQALDSELMLAIQGIMKCYKRRNDNRRLVKAFDAEQPLTGINA